MFKLNFLKVRTRKSLRNNKSIRTSIPYQQAKSIGIIFTVEDKQKHDAVKTFIQQLKQDGKKVNVLEFLPTKKENYEFLFDFFTIDDLSFWGVIQSESAMQFAETPFDFLFSIDTTSHPLILSILARSKAHCRVGKLNELESEYFEMMIDQNGTTKELIDTMYKYTKQLH